MGHNVVCVCSAFSDGKVALVIDFAGVDAHYFTESKLERLKQSLWMLNSSAWDNGRGRNSRWLIFGQFLNDE